MQVPLSSKPKILKNIHSGARSKRHCLTKSQHSKFPLSSTFCHSQARKIQSHKIQSSFRICPVYFLLINCENSTRYLTSVSLPGYFGLYIIWCMIIQKFERNDNNDDNFTVTYWQRSRELQKHASWVWNLFDSSVLSGALQNSISLVVVSKSE